MGQRIPEHDFVTLQGKSSLTFTRPPLDGSLNIAMLVDWHARHSPNHTWAVFPKGPGEELQHVTWRHLSYATQKVAALLQKEIQAEPKSIPVVAVLANRDTLTYSALWLGVVRAGFTAFLISPRNSLAGVTHLLKVSGCVVILGSSDHLEKKLIDGVMANSQDQIKLIESPVFSEIFDLSIDCSKPYDPPLPEMEPPGDTNATSLILHSSGSTSFPKPIPLSHLIILMWARVPYYSGQDICGKRVGTQATPPFHAMGFGHVLALPVASGCIIATFEPQEPPVVPSPDIVLEAGRKTEVDFLMTPPSNLVEWSKDPDAVSYLATVEFVRSASGPMPSPVGDFLVSKGVRLLNGWGSTELGNMSTTYPHESYGVDWEYIEPMPNTNPIFEPDREGVYEICFGCSETRTPAVFNDPENRIYRTNDLVEMHPTRKGFFKVIGRADDQLMLSTGEKTNPGPLESTIRGCPLVRAVLYFGRGRFQNGVLVEPSPGNEIDPTNAVAVSEFRNAIWIYVENANKIAPTHSRIFKEMILIASPEKPFHYTPKGSVSRHRTLELYESEIEAIYGALEEVSTSNVKLPTSWTEQNASSYVKAIVVEVMRSEGPDISDNDLFIQGCDSLQATVIRNRLQSGLRETMKSPTDLPPDWVYANSTIPLLSTSFYKAATMGSLTSEPASADSSVDIIETTVRKYTSNFPKHIGKMALPTRHIILLSGATGTLGCYLLSTFAKDPRVSLVYAVNRPSSSRSGYQRQTEALRNRGLDTTILHDGSVVLIDADLSKPDFGISDKTFLEQMQSSVTCIVHNAWRLDFNLGIASFVPNIESTRNLIDFALGSPYADPPSIIFTSSIGTVAAHPSGRIEEKPGDPRWVMPNGYAQSKFTAERILEAAPLKSCRIRVGQLSGSRVNGAWNISDWFPMIVKSGEITGCLPIRNDEVSWLPTDAAAQAIFELAMAESIPAVAHIVHPRPVYWSGVIKCIAESIGAQAVPYDEWIAKVEKETDVTKNPAFKLLSYYKAKAPSQGATEKTTIETEKTAALSPTLAALSQLARADFDKWIDYWREQGFLKTGLSNEDLSNGDLSNGNLTKEDLSKEDLNNKDLSNGSLTKEDLSNDNLSNGNLTKEDPNNSDPSNGDLSNGSLGNGGLNNKDPGDEDLSHGSLGNGDLNIGGLSNGDLGNEDLSNGNLTKEDLSKEDLSKEDPNNSDPSNGDLSNGGLNNGDPGNEDLSNGSLGNGDLNNGNLSKKDLSKEYPNNSDLSNGNLSKEDLSKEDLNNSDLSNGNPSKEDLVKEDRNNRDLGNGNLSKEDLTNGSTVHI
ncbi:hypothetical protein AJ80_01975 [Polytolypa hystricis UAMH7299]|uniref:Carrier domain-containing protein n=1 Tax=Polytolypa hystricis (strain UAMH7299) TaxID=1447883 RepID=A0A2B7YSE5_POLH7|nr:hypothetical protein AJ80_01975 [Polytolypa hystricis UAMH7299]